MTNKNGKNMIYNLDMSDGDTLYWQHANVIFLSLEELGGSAKRERVLDHIARNGYLILEDKDLIPRGNDIAWENDLSFNVINMRKDGYLEPKKNSGHGIWKITEQGKKSLIEAVDWYYDGNQNRFTHLSENWIASAKKYHTRWVEQYNQALLSKG